MKKKSHFFELYITRILKQIDPAFSISNDAKLQLNSFLCILINNLCSHIKKLLVFCNKRICSIKEIKIAARFFFKGKLLINSIAEGQKAVDNFSSFDPSLKNVAKNTRANIIIPPSLISKIFKDNCIAFSSSSPASVFLAAVLDYLIHDILDLSVILCRDNKRTRINIHHIQSVVNNDIELQSIFKSLNLSILCPPDSSLTIPKASFNRSLKFLSNNAKIPKTSSLVIQTFIEKFIIDILSQALFLSIHANRIKVLPCDILLAFSLIHNAPNYNPYAVSSSKKASSLLEVV